MSEEEMINKIEEFIDGYRLYDTRTGEAIIPYKYGEGQRYVFKESYYAIQQLLNSYINLKQIEQEHQKINGELREEIKQLNEKILDNAGIYQLGFNDGYKSCENKVKELKEIDNIDLLHFKLKELFKNNNILFF